MQTVFPLQYWGSIYYFSEILNAKNPAFEVWETFPRHSYRNKCEILGANGCIGLSVPLKKPNGSKTITKDIIIDNSQIWQVKHWKSIYSAYAKAPYFEHYADEIKKLIFSDSTHLVELNQDITSWILNKVQENKEVTLTKQFTKDQADRLRKYDQKKDTLPHYFQVFEDKYGFQSDASILDAIMNLGPELRLYLKNIGD